MTKKDHFETQKCHFWAFLASFKILFSSLQHTSHGSKSCCLTDRCCISIISTMWRLTSSSPCRMARTASTMHSVSFSARSWSSLVRSDVRATCKSKSRVGSFTTDKVSSAFFASSLANRYPSLINRGWTPSAMYPSACFNNSPMKQMSCEVPSP